MLAKQSSLTDRQKVTFVLKIHKFITEEFKKSITGQESHDVLLTCLTDERRFDNGRSVAAWIIYKTLLQWRSFELEKTNIFDRVVHKIRSSIEVIK